MASSAKLMPPVDNTVPRNDSSGKTPFCIRLVLMPYAFIGGVEYAIKLKTV